MQEKLQCTTTFPSSIHACNAVNAFNAPFLKFTKKADKEQSYILKKAFEEAEANKCKLILNITDNLAHFPPHYLDYEDFLRFKEKEHWLNNCIVDLFFGALNNWAIHHWQRTWEHSNCFFPMIFTGMLGHQAWSHTLEKRCATCAQTTFF